MARVSAALVGGAVVIGSWSLLSVAVGEALVPTPIAAFLAFVRLLASGEILPHAGATLVRLAAGVAGAVLIALPLGIAAGAHAAVDRIVSPVLYVLYPIPKVAFLPIFMVLLGLGNVAKIALLVTVVVFQLAIAIRDAVRTLPREYLINARTLRLSAVERFRHLHLPGALPTLFSALRISVGIGIAVLFLAENYAARFGLGYFIMNTWSMVSYERMFAGVIALAILAAIVLAVVDLMERAACPWTAVRPPMRGARGATRTAVLVFAALTTACAAAEVPAATESADRLRVATFNVHYLAERSTRPVAQWDHRADAVVTTLRSIDADLVAFQEMETFAGSHGNAVNRQAETIAAAFPEFGFAATGDPASFPNTQPILYRRSRLEPTGEGWFFFSETPDVIYARPWLGRFPSYATWARFTDRRSGADLLVVNVHVARERYRNRVRSGRLIAERVASLRRPGERVVVVGDFNALRWMRSVRVVTSGADLAIAGTDGATFHFNRGLHLYGAIDHLLVGEGVTPLAVETVRERPDGVWPSDHYPVFADLSISRSPARPAASRRSE